MINRSKAEEIDRLNFIFTKEFQKFDTNIVIKELKEKGYFSFTNALTKKAARKIEQDSTVSKLSLNNNKISGLHYERQYFLTNLLTTSKEFYDFVTSKFVFSICKKYLGNTFRLKCQRYYETHGGHHMQWHTDNKDATGPASVPGLIFIFYTSDVNDGQLQYIEGSHTWSGKKLHSDYSDEFIEQNYKNKIIDFKLPSGSLIIYNTYGIHRAKPVSNKNFSRKSVFLQVDTEVNNAEPIILDTKFISVMNNEIAMFLGFGKLSNYDAYPTTSLNTLPFSKNVFNIFSKYIMYRIMLRIFQFLPKSLKTFIKKLYKKIKNNHLL